DRSPHPSTGAESEQIGHDDRNAFSPGNQSAPSAYMLLDGDPSHKHAPLPLLIRCRSGFGYVWFTDTKNRPWRTATGGFTTCRRIAGRRPFLPRGARQPMVADRSGIIRYTSVSQ